MTRVRVERIRPKGGLLIDPKLINRELSSNANQVASSMRRQANETVKTWNEKPNIYTKRQTTGDSFYVMLVVDSFIWGILDKGARPHVIKAKNAPFLTFNSQGFIPKTKVNQFASGSGQKASSGFVRVKQVKHPGIKARNWSKEIKERNEKLTSRLMIKSLQKIVANRKKV